MKQPRDMTRRQFDAALRQHGFRKVILWLQDTTGQCQGTSWGMVMNRRGKTLYRASLAKAISERDAHVVKTGGLS